MANAEQPLDKYPMTYAVLTAAVLSIAPVVSNVTSNVILPDAARVSTPRSRKGRDDFSHLEKYPRPSRPVYPIVPVYRMM